jgi:purine-binding chemotaxis protein CheW
MQTSVPTQNVEKQLTFFLGNEEYGVAITKVQEIIRAVPITPMPNTQPFILGLVNLRGRVVPVVDLSRRLGMEKSQVGPLSCIVVVRCKELHVGLLIDRMNEVVPLAPSQVESTPIFGEDVDRELVKGIAKLENRVVLLLDVDVLLAPLNLTTS